MNSVIKNVILLVFSIVMLVNLTSCGNVKTPQELWDDIRYFGHDKINNVEIINNTYNQTIIETIDPCGQEATYDEVILRLSDYSLVSYFRSGSNEFLTNLVPNVNYITTDGTGCMFKVVEQGGMYVIEEL